MKKVLTIKNILSYLPYEIRMKDMVEDRIFVFNQIRGKKFIGYDDNFEGLQFIEDCKPLLIPIKYLIEEIEHNKEKFVPTDYLSDNNAYEPIQDFVDHILNFQDKPNEISWDCCPSWILEKLSEWHIDYQNLIGIGLAIDKNTI